jgi:hypothetical protein
MVVRYACPGCGSPQFKKHGHSPLGMAMEATTRHVIALHVGDRRRESGEQLGAQIPAASRQQATLGRGQRAESNGGTDIASTSIVDIGPGGWPGWGTASCPRHNGYPLDVRGTRKEASGLCPERVVVGADRGYRPLARVSRHGARGHVSERTDRVMHGKEGL